jgi:hypothetical protein
MKVLRAFRCFLVAGICLLPVSAIAQEVQPFPFSEPLEYPEAEEEDEIETDRDSFTPATTTAGFRRTIVESAWSFIDNRDRLDTHSLPELLIRYGWNDWLELRVGTNYEVGGAPNSISSGGGAEEFDPLSPLERETTISYGLKAALTEQNGWMPQSAAIVQASTPVSGEDTNTQLVATYVAGWTMNNLWQFDAALRYVAASAEEDRFGIWAPSVVLNVPVGERWNAHAEYFGLYSDGKVEAFTQHYFSPGAHYLITPDFEIGIRVGWGLSDDAANFFANTGIGWRF